MHHPLAKAVPLLSAIYLVLAFPVVLFQVFATPPFQVADEENHFMRALQIAEGHVFAHRLSDTGAGGDLEPEAVQTAHAFDELKFHPERKLDLGLYGETATIPWGTSPKSPSSFPNTAIYPAFFYLPASVGLAVGKLSGLTILESLYVARLLTAVCASALAALALALCAKGRSALFVILCFPMVLSLFAGVSPDALSIASGAVVVAIWSHYSNRDEEVPLAIRCGAALLLGAIVAARIPLAPLLGLLLLPTSRERRPFTASWLNRATLISLAASMLPIAIGIMGASAAKIAFKPDAGVSPAEQIAFILHHPRADLRVAVLTLQNSGSDYLHQIVGVLGWLDTMLPEFDYTWIAFWLAAAVLVETVSPARALSWPCRAAVACIVLAAVAGVFGALYLAWTPVGNATVDGVQGRYLLVPAMYAILALPSFGRWARDPAKQRSLRSGAMLPTARLLICLAVAGSNLWIVPTTILHRYYGP